jgi:hypothetical protein
MRLAILVVLALARVATAQPADPEASAPDKLQIHGFVSQGAFYSTDNDYIGASSRGSAELFEAGLNFSTEPVERLRVGVQLFAARTGTLSDGTPRIDWAFLDYRLRRWLKLRAGIIRIPFGLYNEFVDVDAARTPILMPQAVYTLRSRDLLISHTGFSGYGTLELGAGGSLDYQAWGGSLNIPRAALELDGAELESLETRYAVGGQLMWNAPLEGLRAGVSWIRAVIDFNLQLDQELIDVLVAMGLVEPTYDGALFITQRPASLYVGSLEYTRGDWTFAAEYVRQRTTQKTSLAAIPDAKGDSERFYAMVNRQLSRCWAASAYYSVIHSDANHRTGRDPMRFPIRHVAFQRDAALTLRFDVNDHWLWKAEAHFIDGAADLSRSANPNPERYWGLFLLKTTVTF